MQMRTVEIPPRRSVQSSAQTLIGCNHQVSLYTFTVYTGIHGDATHTATIQMTRAVAKAARGVLRCFVSKGKDTAR